MICNHCDCANQPVLLDVMVPVPQNDASDSVKWVFQHWCLDCIDEVREMIAGKSPS